ncbi:MAG: AAA family ATPase, partial [Actinomycetota bacterium]|nr:AAA family ATPase [Actinomycetota bacterium]
RPGRLALAFLVAERHRPVSRDELGEVVWGDALPRSWEQLVRGLMFKLRRTLAAAGLDPAAALTTAGGTYQLHLPNDALVDVEEVEPALAGAQRALTAGDADQAYGAAVAAAAIASRPFLPEGEGPWFDRHQRELRQLRLRALEAAAEAAEAQGRWPEAVSAAEEAVGEEPFRESAYLRLMAAHASAGNRGEALRAYERCRRQLADELGVSPSPATETAYLALLGDESESPRGGDPASGPLPLPPELASPTTGLFVGRRAETSRLAAALARTATEGRQLVLVAGEPGIGKTTLVAHMARAAHVQGARVLYGRCDEDLGIAYQPFVEALSYYVMTCPSGELATHLGTHGGELTRLAPCLRGRVQHLPSPAVAGPEEDRYRLFEVVSGLLTVAAAKSPVVLVLDDLHWAAAPTLLLLRYLLRATAAASTSLVVVGTYRHTEIGPDHPLLATLAQLRRETAGVERILLEGLDEEGVAALVDVAGGPIDGKDALARAVHAHTAGNPFFVGELLRHLVETGGRYRRQGRWSYYEDTEGLGVPDGVREVVARRLARLSPSSNRTLVMAAVVGSEFEVDLLDRVVESSDTGSALDGVEEAAAAHLVVEVSSGQYRFAHALVRDTIYSGLSATRSARLHRHVGEAIELLPGATQARPGELAHHFAAAATAGGAAKAADYAMAAAQLAFSQAAWEDAVGYLDAGLKALDSAEPPDLERRCDLLLTLAETWARHSNPRKSSDAAALAGEAARTIGSAERLGRAARWYLFAAPYTGTDLVASALELGSEALAVLGEAEPALRSLILARLSLVQRADICTAEANARRALDLARRSGDSEALGVALDSLCQILAGAVDTTERLAIADELMAAAPDDGWDGWRIGPHHRARAHLRLGDRAGFEADVATAEALSARHRFLWHQREGLWPRVVLALLDGHFEMAEMLAGEARALVSLPQRAEQAFTEHLFRVRFEQGRLAECLVDLETAMSLYPENSSLQAMLAVTLAEAGRLNDALREFDRLAGCGFASIPRDLRPVTVFYLAEAAATLDDPARSADVASALLPYSGQIVVAFHCAGAVDRALAMVATAQGRFEEAARWFDAAIATEAGLRAPPLVARTGVWYARMLLARAGPDDLHRAEALLDASIEIAERLGMAGLTATAQKLVSQQRTDNGGSTLRP